MNRRIVKISILPALLALLIGCASKITAPEKSGTSLSLKFDISDASPKLIAAVDQFRVTVVDPAVSETLIVAPLIFNASGQIAGQIDSLPAEINLQFTAEALDMQSSTVIFRGAANTVLVANVVNNVQIDLSPVVPLMKLTPRRHIILGADTATHFFDVKIFNVDSLFGAAFRVRYDPVYLIPVSAKLSTSQDSTTVIFFESDGTDAFGSFKAISLTGTDTTQSIVDTDGDGILCQIGYVLEQPFSSVESTYVTIEPTGLTHQNRTQLPVGNIYPDDAFIEITP